MSNKCYNELPATCQNHLVWGFYIKFESGTSTNPRMQNMSFVAQNYADNKLEIHVNFDVFHFVSNGFFIARCCVNASQHFVHANDFKQLKDNHKPSQNDNNNMDDILQSLKDMGILNK